MRLSHFRFAIVLSAACLALPLVAGAQEWTRFRGPNGSGLSETTFHAQWTPADYAWNVTLPGAGHSSPVVWGDKVFVTCADENATRMVLCISAKDGSTLWKRDFTSHTFREHGDNSYASATPVVDADHVYVCWNTPEEFTLLALTHKGTEAWKTDLGGFVSQHGGGNSPIVVGDMVLLGADQEDPGASFVFGVDRMTGAVKWKTKRKTDKFSAATPVIFHGENGQDTAVFDSKGEGMTGIDPKTGKVVWQEKNIFNLRTVGSPTTGAGLVFATCGEGAKGHLLVAIKPSAGGEASVAWKVQEETPYVPTPLVKGDLLFYWADRGVVTCAHAATGEVIWQGHVPGSYFSSPICAGNTLFNVNKAGEVVAVSIGEKFEILGKNLLNEKCHATPAISGNRMFVRTYTHLYCIKGTGGQASR